MNLYILRQVFKGGAQMILHQEMIVFLNLMHWYVVTWFRKFYLFLIG